MNIFINFICQGKVYEFGIIGDYLLDGMTREELLAFKMQFIKSYMLFKGINEIVDWIR